MPSIFLKLRCVVCDSIEKITAVKNPCISLYVWGVLVFFCMCGAETIPQRIEEERYSEERQVLEAYLHQIQQVAAKTERIVLVIDEIKASREIYPPIRSLRHVLEGALLEHVRKLVEELKINPHYKRYIAARNPVFHRWSPRLEIKPVPSSDTLHTTGEKDDHAYAISASDIGPCATDLYYLDAKKTSELRYIFSMIWKRKTGQDPPSGW